MNESEARSILGVSNTASLQEARKAYKSLVKVFHPDLNSATPEQSAQATQATARINQAWDALEDLAKRGLLGKFVEDPREEEASGSSFRLRPRHPNWSECVICGSTPATNADFRFVQTFLVWLQTGSLSGAFCRACGSEVFRDAQSRSLTRGWWGIGVVALPFFLIGNLFARRKVRDQEMPSYRDFNVVTPTDQPLLPGRPVLKRPAVLIALVAIVLAGLGLVVSSASPTPSTTAPSPAAATSFETAAAPSAKPTGTNSEAATPSVVSDADRQRARRDVLEAAQQSGLLRKQAECIADDVSRMKDADFISIMSDTPSTTAKAVWDGIVNRCTLPQVGDCYAERGISFQPVECSDTKSKWRVAEANIVSRFGTCDRYPQYFETNNLAYCLERVKG